MATSNERLHEIDALVEDSGHTYNPVTEQFDAAVGTDAENNLAHDWHLFLPTLPGVNEQELGEYVAWKSRQAEYEYDQHRADEMVEDLEKGQAGS